MPAAIDTLPEEKNSSFIKDVIQLMAGTTGAQAIGLLVVPFITRLYSPGDFGLLTLFISVSAIPSIIACMRYELAIPLPKQESNSAYLVVFSFVSSLFVSILVLILLQIGKEPLLGWLNTPQLGPLLKWIPLSIGLSGFTITLTYWNTRIRKFGLLSIANFSGALLIACSKLIAGRSGHATGSALIYATLFGQFLICIILFFFSFKRVLKHLKKKTIPSGILKVIKRYKKFPLYDSWGALLNTGSWQIPPLLFASYFTESFVGFYALAFRVIQLPMSIIGNSIGHVFFPRISECKASGKPIHPMLESLYLRLVQIGLFPSVILALAGPELFNLVFGEKWETAGFFSQILSPWFFVWFLAWPLSVVFSVLERQGTQLFFNIIIFVSRIGSILIGCIYQKADIALYLYSLSGFLVYGSLCLYVLKIASVPLMVCMKILMKYVYLVTLFLSPLIIMKYLSYSPLKISVCAFICGFSYLIFIISSDAEIRNSIRILTGKGV